MKKVIGEDLVKGRAYREVTDPPKLVRNFNLSKYVWNTTGLSNKVGKLKEFISKFFGN